MGGVAAGMSAATRLRRLVEDAEITVYEMSEHVSYANCGLPYFVGEVITDRAALLLQTPESLWRRFRLDVRVQHKVTKIDPSQRSVTVLNLQNGEQTTDTYDFLVLATGATPRLPDIQGIERALALRNVQDADKARMQIEKSGAKTAAVIGAGFVGVELAENLKHLGLDVTLIQRGSQILPQFDSEMIAPLATRLRENGVNLVIGAEIERITADAVETLQGEVPADVVFVAAGVNPDNSLAKDAGLRMGETGGLWVDSSNRTSDSAIFAAGDAVEKSNELTGEAALIPLANLANRHGRLIADAIAGRTPHAHTALGTAIIGAFGLSAAVTGLTEKAALKAGIAHQIVHVHPNNHASYYPGARRVSLKVLFEPKTGRLLGAQGYGEDGVDKRIDVLATAIRAGLTISDLMDLELAYAPQFGSAKDAVNMAGYVGENLLNGTTPNIQWHAIAGVQAQLIDVRTRQEHDSGHIPGSVNIPVDELRERLDEVNRGPVVVYCAVGQRGHIATQILTAHGLEVKNLDGGYTTWSSIAI